MSSRKNDPKLRDKKSSSSPPRREYAQIQPLPAAHLQNTPPSNSRVNQTCYSSSASDAEMRVAPRRSSSDDDTDDSVGGSDADMLLEDVTGDMVHVKKFADPGLPTPTPPKERKLENRRLSPPVVRAPEDLALWEVQQLSREIALLKKKFELEQKLSREEAERNKRLVSRLFNIWPSLNVENQKIFTEASKNFFFPSSSSSSFSSSSSSSSSTVAAAAAVLSATVSPSPLTSTPSAPSHNFFSSPSSAFSPYSTRPRDR